MRLEGKVAVVTGGGNGIGREISKLMGAEGAKVVVNDLGTAVDGAGESSSAADQTVQMIKDAGGEATPNYESVATPEGGQNIIQTAVDAYGKLDILVHVAGILRDRMIFNMSIEEWDAVINVHLRGAYCVNRPACVLMRQQKSGCIINFSSISGAGNSGQANYAAAKAGHSGADAYRRARHGEIRRACQRHLAGGRHPHDRHGSRGGAPDSRRTGYRAGRCAHRRAPAGERRRGGSIPGQRCGGTHYRLDGWHFGRPAVPDRRPASGENGLLPRRLDAGQGR